MSTCEFPVGHPKIIVPAEREVRWSKPEDNPYKGLIMCKISAPSNLKMPLLPYRSTKGCLLFPTCRECAETLPLDDCKHLDKNRSWWSCYTHAEINKSLELGYSVTAVNEVNFFQMCIIKKLFLKVWHYENWRSGDNSLFRKFVNLFLKLKTENSGFPQHILSIENVEERVMAKLQFLIDYKNKYDLDLEYAEIRENEALRFIAKIFLNSLW